MRNDVLIEIARILTTEASLTEALRLVAREVARFAEAETAAAYLRIDARSLWVRPDDRAWPTTEGGARDVRTELRTGDGGTVWVRLRARAVTDGAEEYWEGAIEDITAQRRAEEAERRAEALRAVAQLANAAAHEINNPLAIITGRLELLRRHLTQPDQQARFEQVMAASRRITEIISHMGRITRLETMPDSEFSPMLDLRRMDDPR